MNLPEKVLDKTLTKQLSRHSSVKGQDRVATWVLDTQGFEQCNKGEIPGCLGQFVMCLATDVNLTADPGVVSSIPDRSHTFVEIDHEKNFRVILLPYVESS